MNKINLTLIFGTRPETIKMFPLISEIKKYPHLIDFKIVVTGQHREMLDQMLEIFKIIPDYDLDIMEQVQSLSQITKNSLIGIERILKKEKPNMVLVQGDTTTAFAGALAAFYQKIKIGHIEAGLRTNNKYYPFPEEINRHLTSVLADLHFAPTAQSCKNLLSEGVKREDIFICGNTVIDSLFLMIKKNHIFTEPLLRDKKIFEKKIILVTVHRRENWGEPLKNICQALIKLLDEHSDLLVIIPLHKNPEIRKTVNHILKDRRDILLLDTLDYGDMINLMSKIYIILTDSGGIQEEAPSLGKPIFVLRDETERPEAVEAGVVKLIGTNQERIVSEVNIILTNKDKYMEMAKRINPYGDGKASKRIIEKILGYFNLIDQFPDEFQAR
ncbi:MAG: UDP-N-acetylglucosamine 2-epimerase (non-hydrolyzing) [Candidatus Infernicultor aquiphilus]|uniref:UDP-N-acetylglucosamine 2-epimerase (non-hydrolyzing) n=1 Tax=Candidatus Infernicultor aquiphilus TaxID=1805029 RepID=A0A1J5GC07_9BACT|nr:UDP-N-acetylglucosamine 2-epimerase (non-hydrolyzing) [bacterium]OIP70265.1 MAG: UDP-N-acetylglucosamine 2-epimerase [Candidatus Atribacteria bacterium CG2_30_33_13]PIU25547.1 MAG: UDP-N-acetylglucosamine 2-epimerase (non-hydrolyzing) [Candidatus Atribacteria bacterium CG08_land_8_20_14_0_20_33_29]PIW11554.1 MAG: UDP-N-acetylglucosamine 2-epimerase (non-hydrolyzing) [Candidatus Atribacteria bacterium CG17_big_fil_post_rev_8_21_14_2_50_34_11]PIX34565.1 MAG: UDP-N-acetylglucosamine 2-epimerase